MPIKVQRDLPAKGILENENIFVMDENRAVQSGYPSIAGLYLEPDASKAGHRTSASACLIQHAVTGRCHLFNGDKPCITQYIGQSSEPLLYDV